MDLVAEAAAAVEEPDAEPELVLTAAESDETADAAEVPDEPEAVDAEDALKPLASPRIPFWTPAGWEDELVDLEALVYASRVSPEEGALMTAVMPCWQ